MGKTKELRKLVRKQLSTVAGETYHKQASPQAVYPYKTFALTNISFMDARSDYDLVIDVWDRGECKDGEDIADQIEKVLDGQNFPTDKILATMFRDGRTDVTDPDKTLQHIQLRFIVQLYEMEE